MAGSFAALFFLDYLKSLGKSMEIAHQPQFDMGEAVRATIEQVATFPRVALQGLQMFMAKEKENLKKIREESGAVEKEVIRIRGTPMYDSDDYVERTCGGRVTLPPDDPYAHSPEDAH